MAPTPPPADSRQDTARRWTWRAWLLPLGALLSTAVFTAWLVFEWGGPWTTVVVDDVGTMITPGLAAAACFRAARRSEGRRRLYWYLFSASALSWGLGQTIWTWFELVLKEAPFPSPADAGFLLAIPLAVAALLVQVASVKRSATTVRTVLDGFIISLSLTFISWDVVVGPVVAAGGDSAFVQTLTLAYPVSDVVLVAVVIFTLTRMASGYRTPALLVGAGLASISLADSVFAYFSLVGDYATGLYADAGWFGGYLLIALGAMADDGEPTQVDSTPTRLSVALPYFPVAISLAMAVGHLAQTSDFDPVLWSIGLAMLVAVFGRQLATMFEDVALVRFLEEKVDERTAELREAGIALERRERHFRSLVQNASDLIIVASRSGTMSYVSPSIARILGRSPSALEGRHLELLVHPQERERIADLLIAAETRPDEALSLEWSFGHADGTWRIMETAVTAQVVDGAVRALVLNSRDVTERCQLEERLRHEALHDSLTELPNRMLFRDRLEHALVAQTRFHTHLAVLFVDVDDFKLFNDTAGHQVGDGVLQAVATRLTEAVRPGDTVARLGGDEFAILLPNLTSTEEAECLAERVLNRLQAPLEVDGRDARVSASIGLSFDHGGTSTADEMLRHADLAMYMAKGQGKATFRTFHPEMHAALVERMSVKAELGRALQADQLALHYQPVVELGSGRVVGVEALMRWTHPELGSVPPTSFIPLAEESGTIQELGAWALRTACEQAVTWDSDPATVGLEMNVNLSPRQLAAPGLVPLVDQVLSDTGLDPQRLVLEITETVLMEDIEAIIGVLHSLRRLGVQLAIDDFGTGYSSLAYLARLPVQVMKIDRSFILDLAEDGRVALIRSIVQLAAELDMEIVAEGVETTDIAHELRGLGCQLAQGFWTSRPLPPEALRDFLRSRSGTGVAASFAGV